MSPTAQRYLKFAAMILTSMVVMFAIKYLNTYTADHVHFSRTRFFMTFMMGAAMAVVMLSFMLSMYRSSRINLAIYTGSVVVFLAALWLPRSQTTIHDEAWMPRACLEPGRSPRRSARCRGEAIRRQGDRNRPYRDLVT